MFFAEWLQKLAVHSALNVIHLANFNSLTYSTVGVGYCINVFYLTFILHVFYRIIFKKIILIFNVSTVIALLL